MQLPSLTLLTAILAVGCIKVKSDPIRIEPIQITIDVNVKIDRALDDFFDDLDSE